MMRVFWITGIAIILCYQLIPNLIERHFDPQVIRRLPNQNNKIALTFDDGPDEVYTPQLLDLLRDQEVHATFFLVAKNAQAHPELVKRMAKEGHEIGLHSLNHRGFWLETPRQTRVDFEQSIQIFENLEIDLIGFRPPWGTFNALTRHYAHKADLPIYLWSRNAKDWEIETKPEDIINRVTQKLAAGEIIVLHDAGGDPKAPEHTIEALRTLLPQLKENFEFVSLQKGGDLRELDSTPISSIGSTHH